MQNCFREYPEIYGAELDEDEDDVAPVDVPADGAPLADAPAVASKEEAPSDSLSDITKEHGLVQPSKPDPNGLVPESYHPDETSKKEKTKKEAEGEVERIVPKVAHDATQQAADRK